MSELERHLSKLVEEQSPQGVDPRYSSSPPGGHFAILQMLTDPEDLLDLLVLEATGKVPGVTGVYGRIGEFALYCLDRGELLLCVEVVEELRREPWGLESVIIV